MKEVSFIRQNKDKWKHYESELASITNPPTDQLEETYLDVLSDLAYAQSQYTNSRIVVYLNGLAGKVHDRIYGRHKLSWYNTKKMFLHDMPQIIADAHMELIAALVIFLAFTAAGIILTIQDPEHAKDILGEGYVQMTLDNIKNGTPVAVYGTQIESDMFWSISTNNILLSFKMYASGVIPIIGPTFFMGYNALMLGEFQTFMFQQGVGPESMSAIWLHGTFEILSLIIAGGAALVLGKGWLLPGTYTRKEAIKQSGMRSVKILVSTIPLFVVAAFIESFATRHTEWPLGVKLAIILLSLTFMVTYYVVLPYKIYTAQKAENKGGDK